MCLENAPGLNLENSRLYLQSKLITITLRPALSSWPDVMDCCHPPKLLLEPWLHDPALLLLPDQGFIKTFSGPTVLIKMAESATVFQRRWGILPEAGGSTLHCELNCLTEEYKNTRARQVRGEVQNRIEQDIFLLIYLLYVRSLYLMKPYP